MMIRRRMIKRRVTRPPPMYILSLLPKRWGPGRPPSLSVERRPRRGLEEQDEEKDHQDGRSRSDAAVEAPVAHVFLVESARVGPTGPPIRS
jgi:hypothetical protein